MGLKITGAELEIMEYLWEREQDCTFADLLDYFNRTGKKDWCKQTMNTYLLRLKKRGLLQKQKNGAKAVYHPAVTKLQYNQMCAREILEESYNGVLSNFIAALTGKETITEVEKQELLDYIEKER